MADEETTPPNESTSSKSSDGSPPAQKPTSSDKAGAVDPKICGVCGDKALGNNFNAITCESCKAFFRRNALRTKEFTCPFDNNCKVDAITRRFCQRCRLKKCFDIGMKKEWIMTDEEKKIKKQKIEQNRKKRSSLENSGGNGEAGSPEGEEEDGDSDDAAPPAPKRPHVSSDSQLAQRLTEPIICTITGGGTTNGHANVVAGEGGANLQETPSSPTLPPKLQKQPMGLHNQIQNIPDERPTHNRTTARKSAKGRNRNVIKIDVNPLSTSLTAASATPSSPPSYYQDHSNHSNSSVHTEPSYHHHYPEHVHKQDIPEYSPPAAHSHQAHHPSSVPQSSAWMEGGDSSNSSLSPPTPSSYHQIHSQAPATPHHQRLPPLIKYPPNKRPRIYEHHDDHHPEDQPPQSEHQQSTPLLASLIQPSYPESSPDYTNSSPPAPQIIQSSYEDNDTHHLRGSNGYHPSLIPTPGGSSPPHQIVRHHHIDHSQHQNYHRDDYERSSPPSSHSPPMITSYDNGYHHHHRYGHSSSPPPTTSYHSSDADHHHHHHHYHPYQEDNHQEQNQVARVPSLSTMDSILSIAIAAEFNSFGMMSGSIPNSKDLNKMEQAKLNELLLASQALHAPVDAERPFPKESDSADPSLLNVINLTEIAIRRLIKMSKKISGFKNMCQEDQIALLKGGCTEMMILRSAVTYDPDRDSWQIPHSDPGYNINLGVLKEARGNLYEEHQRFVKSFRSHWRKDENIMIILCAITLFTPERHNVIHRDVVKLEQDSYYYLLKRYLESTLNGCEAKSNYLQLIRKIAELRALNSSHVRVFLEMNPKEVEPLLIEIFDLK